MNRIGVVFGFALLSLCALVAAQEPAAPVEPAVGPAQSFVLDKTDISSAANTIGRLYGVKVLAQENLKGEVTANVRNATIETALTMVSAPNGLLWRQFTLTVKPTDSVTPKTLAGLIDALDAIQYAGIVMKGPKGVSTVFVARDPAANGPTAVIGAVDGSKATTYYYLYDPKAKPDVKLADAKTPVQPAPTVPTTGTPTFKLAPDNEANLTQIAQWLGGLDEDTRQQIVHSLMHQMPEESDDHNGGPPGRRDRGNHGD